MNAVIGSAARMVGGLKASGGLVSNSSRIVPEEVPIAFSYGGSTHAVMMATPADLEDFAVGFSLAEGIIERADEVVAIEAIEAGEPNDALRGFVLQDMSDGSDVDAPFRITLSDQRVTFRANPKQTK